MIHIFLASIWLRRAKITKKVTCKFQFLRSIKFCACQAARKLTLQEFNNNLIQRFMKEELMKMNFTMYKVKFV